jgi:hypothetical protein
MPLETTLDLQYFLISLTVTTWQPVKRLRLEQDHRHPVFGPGVLYGDISVICMHLSYLCFCSK